MPEPDRSDRPLIGISAESAPVPRYWGTEPHQVVGDTYVNAVRAAGGLAVVLPVGDEHAAASIIGRLDGLVLTGGNDIDPSFYGEDRLDVGTGGELDLRRDRFDLALIDAAVAAGLPTLCICRGQQILNVWRGGSLVQHLDTHGVTPADERTSHDLEVDVTSRFARRFPTLTRSNTYHHQAVARLGRGVRVAATTVDGVIEAIELDDVAHVVSVQWHPEMLIDHPEHLALFEWLVRAVGAGERA